ncbi:MAG: hypothetical protein PWQ39_1003 [Thermacetogenium sp.]|nr:hypothetical protein [Thermacetogenium sp.]
MGSVNKPIKIDKDMVIKAITIGPGKEDSEVVTFYFKVDYSGEAVDPTKVPGGPPTAVALDRSMINLKPGATYQLAVTVTPFNADDQRVIWSSSDTRVATVDTRGLVTVVGPGTATITVRTVVGNHTATCIVKAADEEDRSPEAALAAGEFPGNAGQGPGNVEDVPEEALKASEEATESPETPQNELPAEESPVDESKVPEGRGRYLIAKKDLAAAAAGEDFSSEPPGSGSWQVFEMLPAGGVPLPLQEEENWAGIFAAVVFFLLFLSGAGKKYAEYAKEL